MEEDGRLSKTSTLLALILVTSVASGAETWRGLTVSNEVKCGEDLYDPTNFRHDPDVEEEIATNLGGWWSPYDGYTFRNEEESDIEHIVSKSEARESGLCNASAEIQKQFVNDFDNLTLATCHVNRNLKRSKDAADWFPEFNRCWFAGRVLAVKLEYRLTVDEAEKNALESVLTFCSVEDILRPS